MIMSSQAEHPMYKRMEKYMQSHALRLTRERAAVIEKILEFDAPFDAAAVCRAMESHGELRVSRATVYNTLKICVDAGVVRPSLPLGSPPLWEVEKPEGVSSQLLCNRCGSLRRVSLPELTGRVLSGHYGKFKPTGCDIIIRGICPRCQRELKKPIDIREGL